MFVSCVAGVSASGSRFNKTKPPQLVMSSCDARRSGSFITQVDTRFHRGILGLCATGGQWDIYLTAPASVQCLELTMSVVMGINNADPRPDKNSLLPWLPPQHCSLCSTSISDDTHQTCLIYVGLKFELCAIMRCTLPEKPACVNSHTF